MKFLIVNYPLIFNSKIYPVGSIVNLPPVDRNLPNVVPVPEEQSSPSSFLPLISQKNKLKDNSLAQSDSSFVPVIPQVSDSVEINHNNSVSDNPAVKKRGRPKKS